MGYAALSTESTVVKQLYSVSIGCGCSTQMPALAMIESRERCESAN